MADKLVELKAALEGMRGMLDERLKAAFGFR